MAESKRIAVLFGGPLTKSGRLGDYQLSAMWWVGGGHAGENKRRGRIRCAFLLTGFPYSRLLVW